MKQKKSIEPKTSKIKNIFKWILFIILAITGLGSFLESTTRLYGLGIMFVALLVAPSLAKIIESKLEASIKSIKIFTKFKVLEKQIFFISGKNLRRGLAVFLFILSAVFLNPDSTKSNITPVTNVQTKIDIPGLQPVDVYLNLTNKGFDKVGPKKVGDVYTWTLSSKHGQYAYLAEITSHTTSSVMFVRGTVLDYSNTINPADFLSYIASLTYEGSTPEIARAWVRTTLPKVMNGKPISNKIGNVYFVLASSRKGFASISISSDKGYLGIGE